MSITVDALAKRVDELETQAAFQDEMHEILNTTVAKQDAEILELKRQFSLLSERLKEMGDVTPGAAPQDETPPHY
jgi:SlyX protein